MSKPSDEAVRKEFEAWARQLVADKAFNLTPCSNPSCGPKFHHYQFDSTNGDWAAWQAARSAVIDECAKVPYMTEKELRELAPEAAARFYDTNDDYYTSEDLICDAFKALKER